MADTGGSAAHARDLLAEFGFTEYEATCLVTLIQQPGATAAEVAANSTLPRSRVYDVADDLAERGYLEVKAGDPKQYRPMPTDRLVSTLRRDYDQTIDRLGDALDEVEPRGPDTGPSAAVWSFAGEEAALARSWELIEDADARVWMLVREDLLSADCIAVLADAADRGVDLTLATEADEFETWLAEAVPAATLVGVPEALDPADGPHRLIRLQVTDDDAVMTVTACQESPAMPTEYRGCLARGEECGFVRTHAKLLGLDGAASE